MASYRWVVRKKIQTMKAEDVAHLVVRTGIVRAAPAICGERLLQEDFWEIAKNKTIVCKTCKKLLREKQSQDAGADRTGSGRKKS